MVEVEWAEIRLSRGVGTRDLYLSFSHGLLVIPLKRSQTDNIRLIRKGYRKISRSFLFVSIPTSLCSSFCWSSRAFPSHLSLAGA